MACLTELRLIRRFICRCRVSGRLPDDAAGRKGRAIFFPFLPRETHPNVLTDREHTPTVFHVTHLEPVISPLLLYVRCETVSAGVWLWELPPSDWSDGFGGRT